MYSHGLVKRHQPPPKCNFNSEPATSQVSFKYHGSVRDQADSIRPDMCAVGTAEYPTTYSPHSQRHTYSPVTASLAHAVTPPKLT